MAKTIRTKRSDPAAELVRAILAPDPDELLDPEAEGVGDSSEAARKRLTAEVNSCSDAPVEHDHREQRQGKRPPDEPADELAGRLIAATHAPAQAKAAAGLVELASRNEFPQGVAARVGEHLVKFVDDVVIELCPLIGKVLAVDGAEFAQFRLRVAESAAGLALFRPNPEIRRAVGSMLAVWKTDPVIAEGFNRVLDAERDDPDDRPTISVEQASGELGISVQTVHFHIRQGAFGEVARIGMQRFLTRRQIDDFAVRPEKRRPARRKPSSPA
jgi:hypothetical protein